VELLEKLGNLTVEDDCIWGSGLNLIAQFFDIEPMRSAKFFAIAPEMYEALKMARDLWNSDSASVDPQEVLEMIDAVLLKAEGREE
jgi:hypothetical protein